MTTRSEVATRSRLERIRDALRFTTLGFLISLAFFMWTAVFWVPVLNQI